MRTCVLFLATLAIFYSMPLAAQTADIFINEAMGSNRNTIADTTGSFEDWLELYNATSIPKLLNGYYVSNDLTNPTLFRLSGNLQIPAKGFILLWASKDTTRGKTHLPFKISASGERLYVFAPDGLTLVDSLNMGQQKTDVSYGRTKDGASTFGFFSKPTPRSTNNNSTAYAGILNPPSFSKPAGFYGSAFSLSITSDDPAATIAYTTDGSIPDAGNIKGTGYRYKNVYPENPGDPVGPFLTDTFRSINYVSSLNVKDASTNPNRLSLKSTTYQKVNSWTPTTIINKGTVVRAVATRAGYISSEPVTATYFVTTGGTNKYTLPLMSIALPESYLSSWDSGIYNAGIDFENWRTLNPTATANGGTPANWSRGTEFPASFELFTANATSRQLQTNIGVTVNGNYTRQFGQKAFRVYFRSSYGASDLGYQIFPDLPYTNYERLVLHNAGNDMPFAHMRDMVAEAAVKHLYVGTQHQQPAIAFVNGEFWGLLNIRQRYDDNHFKQVWGIDPDSLDLILDQNTVQYGTNAAINTLRNFISANDLSVAANYQAVQTQMDIDNFIDYQITEIFFGNNDWPAVNSTYFRKRVPYTPGAPAGQDGRFRWTLNDLDYGFSLYGAPYPPSYNTLAWATGTSASANPAAWSTEMLRKLLANATFRNKFITRYTDLLNTTFQPANIDGVINYYRNMLSPHIAEETARWKHIFNATSWSSEVDRMVQFADQRPAFAQQHIRSQFAMDTVKKLTVNVSDSAQGFVRVNTVDITPAFPGVPKTAYPWTGYYYQEAPVTLVAKPKQGFRFVGWIGDTTSTKDTLIVTLSSSKSFTAQFQSLPVIDSGKVITYWHFNNLPSTTAPNSVPPVIADTSLAGNAVITYEGTNTSNNYMDRSGATEGSIINLQFNKPSGYALRPRNPSSIKYLLIKASTAGYKNIILKYATSRSNSGAQYQRVSYTNDVTAANVVWTLKADSILVPSNETNFGLQAFGFSNDVNTGNNAKFAVKIEFFGTNATLTSGNNRFDNITFNGIPLSNQDYPTVAVSSDKNNVCSNSKVTFTATTTNAGASPVFQWIKNNVNVGTNQSSYLDSSFQNGDAIYCKLTVNDTTLSSNKVFITVVSSDLSITGLTKNSPSACGNNDGDIVINRSGGTAPFQYSLNNVNYFASNSFTNLGPGNYTACVKDAKGCVASFSDVLVKIPTLTISLSKTSPSACGSNNGVITINQSGGNPPFTYSLNGVNYSSNNVFNNLAAGNYKAYVKDADDCIVSVTEALANASALVVSSVNTTSPSGCTTNDGSLTINVSGGSVPYQYSLNGVDYFPSNAFSNLAAGNFKAYVKDVNGCIATATGVLASNSTLGIASVNTTATSACNKNDGSLTINTTGGVAPLQYSLDGLTYSSNNVFSNLAAGTYTAYVTDAGGCVVMNAGVVVSKFSSSLAILDLSKSSASVCRDDGSINIINTGGYSPFMYSLNKGEYVTESQFNNLAAGTYTAYIQDAKGCVDSLVTVLERLAPIAISTDKTPASACSDDGILSINVTGGDAPYEYSLDNVNYSHNKEFFGLAAGNYTVYVRDEDGCVASHAEVLARDSIVLAVIADSVSACSSDGKITINQTGGDSPFTYSINGTDYFTTNVFSNLPGGNYTAYVKDGNGCIASTQVVLAKASALSINGITKVDVSAKGASDGKITINQAGGISPYQYSLDNLAFVSTNVFNNLAAGTYTAYVKDARGCTASATTTIISGQSITFPAIADKSTSDAPFQLTATASSGLQVSYRLVSGPVTISGNTVTIVGTGDVTIEASQAGNENYSPASPVTQTFKVLKAQQTITFQPLVNKVYGDAPFALGATSSSQLPVGYRIVSGPATLSDNIVTLTGTGLVTIEASQPGNASYNAAAPVQQSFTVAAANQIITFNPLSNKTYGDAPFALSAIASSGLAVAFKLVSGPATVANNTVAITGAGVVTIEASQTGNANYSAAVPVQQSFTVNPASQAITFDPLADKTFGDAPFALTASSSSSLAVAYRIVSGPATVSGATVSLTGAGIVTVEASQAGNANYSAATAVQRSFTVNKAAQIITFGALANKTYGDAPFTVSATASSGLPVGFRVVSGPATVSGNTVTLTGTGVVVLEASQSGNANYNAANVVQQSFTVNPSTTKQSQTITFGTLAYKAYNSPPFDLTATASSGLPVQYRVVSGPITISGITVTITGVGSATIEASQPGNGSYNAAAPVQRSFTIGKAGQSITYVAPAPQTYGNPPFAMTSTATSGLPVQYRIVSGPATVSGNIVTLMGAGTVAIELSQPGNANYAAAYTLQRSFVVSSPSTVKSNQTISFGALANKTYGDAPVTLNATASSGLPVSYSLVSGPASISGNTVTITGAGTVTVQASQNGDANYNPASLVQQSFTVAKASQSISFGALPNKTLGDPAFNVSATSSSGLPVSFSVFSGPATISGNTVTLTGTGTVIIQATQAGDANYNAAAPVQQSFTVTSVVTTKQNQTINFPAQAAKTYGDAPFVLSATASSGLSVSFRIVSGPGTIAGSTVTITGAGTITVEASQAGDANYNSATPVQQAIVVNKAAQTINFGALANKTYGDAPFALSATASSGLAVGYRVVSGPATLSGNMVTLTGTGTVVLEASQIGDANYNPASPVQQSFAVNAPTTKLSQTITFGTLAYKFYDSPPFQLTATASSGLPVSYRVVSGPITISGSTVTITGVGFATIEASQPGNATYNAATPVQRSFTVGKAAQSITYVAPPQQTYGNPPFAMTSTASSGLPVQYRIVSGPATVSGNVVTLTGAGTVTIELSQPGNTNYNAANTLQRNFVVQSPPPVVSPGLTKTHSSTTEKTALKERIEVLLYPNPVYRNGVIRIKAMESVSGMFSIYNRSGMLVKSFGNRRVEKGFSLTLNFDGGELASGMYFVRVQNSQGVISKPFEVMK